MQQATPQLYALFCLIHEANVGQHWRSDKPRCLISAVSVLCYSVAQLNALCSFITMRLLSEYVWIPFIVNLQNEHMH